MWDDGTFMVVPNKDRLFELTDGELRTYLALVHHINADKECWPGNSRLAQLTGFNGRTIKNHTKKLEARGFIRIYRRKKAAWNLTNKYEIMQLSSGESMNTSEFSNTTLPSDAEIISLVNDLTRGGESGFTQTIPTNHTHITSSNRASEDVPATSASQNKEYDEKAEAQKRLSRQANQVVGYMRERTGSKALHDRYGNAAAEHRRESRRLVKLYGLDEVREAIKQIDEELVLKTKRRWKNTETILKGKNDV